MRHKPFVILLSALTLVLSHATVHLAHADAGGPRLDVVVSNADIAQVLQTITAKQGLALDVDTSVSGKVSLSLYNKTISEVLDEVAKQANLEYVVIDGRLKVKRSNSLAKNRGTQGTQTPPVSDRAPAAVSPEVAGAEPSGPSNLAGVVNVGNNVRMVKLGFANAQDIAEKLNNMFGKDARIVADERTNSLLVSPVGTPFENIYKIIKAYDRMPDQVLIEAQIIETSNNFVQQMGVSWGTLTKGASPANSVTVKNPEIKGNLNLGVLFGSIDHQKLQALLQVAESEGNAKIISRPKVVTADRMKAVIESGISYNIKTLSSVTSPGSASAGSNTAGTLTGGLQTVSAGLNLNVTPEIVGNELIRLQIDISSSEADLGNSVDGIPGVVRSAAKTSLIVKEGVTATIGGLVKYSQSNTDTGVPFLRNIPLLGWAFKSASTQRNNSELLIFITPRIMERADQQTAANGQ